MITVTLDGEPQGKARPRFRVISPKRGGSFVSTYTPAQTQSYERAIAMVAKIAMRAQPPLEGPLSVSIEAVCGVPRSWSKKKRDAALTGVLRPTSAPDCDNIGKIALDALNTIVYHDDRQVVSLGIAKRYGEQPRLRIEVSTLGE